MFQLSWCLETGSLSVDVSLHHLLHLELLKSKRPFDALSHCCQGLLCVVIGLFLMKSRTRSSVVKMLRQLIFQVLVMISMALLSGTATPRLQDRAAGS